MNKPPSVDRILQSWVGNVGASCTTAATLTALGALGATNLPDVATASRRLSGGGPAYQPPALGDYVGVPLLRRAPLDIRIEQLAADSGIRVRSTTRLCLTPGYVAAPRAGEVVIGNMFNGQEAPGQWGWYGFKPFDPASWPAAGHSLVLAAPEPGGGWAVVDPNHQGLQLWSRPGWALTTTRIQLLD